MRGRGLLAVVAHPDDEAFGCGGTLALHAMRGHAAVVLSLTCSAEERRRELEAASEALGIDAPMVFDGERLGAGGDVIDRISDAIVSRRPEIVITHLPFDYHREHRLCLELVREAIEWAAHATARGDPWRVGRLLLMEVNTLIPTPHVIVDVSEAFDRKMEAIRRYATQLAKFPDGYYQMFSRSKAELRGVQGGCRHAEAFLEEPLTRNSPFYTARSTRDLFEAYG